MRDVRVDIIRVFADGSTMVRFCRTVRIGFGESLFFTQLPPAEGEDKLKGKEE